MKTWFLLTTDHLEDAIWFRDDDDFKVAMNYVAVQAACNTDVAILAFILMSNHVHFVLKGEREDVISFINGFKHRYAIYIRRKYASKEFLRNNSVDVRTIPFNNEALANNIAYVQMNSVAANICSNPVHYRWGTGNAFFNSTPARGKRLEELSERARHRLLRTECTIPAEWMIGEDGYIDPRMYVDVPLVESCFRTAGRMNYFLQSSSKAKKRLETSEDKLPAFRDQVILSALSDLLRTLFHKESLERLSEEEKIEMARQIRYRFSANINQVARVCGLTYPEAAHLFDQV